MCFIWNFLDIDFIKNLPPKKNLSCLRISFPKCVLTNSGILHMYAMNQKLIVILSGVVVVLVLGYSFLWMKSGLIDYGSQTKDEVSGWKTYRDDNKGFEFKYPEKLKLVKEENKVILNHAIPYENYGDCDMMGEEQLYTTLDDFDVSFEIVNQKLSLRYHDGEYSAGTLRGSWAYEGAEGCGHSTYHFPIGEDKTLVVQRAAVQALSGLSTVWDLEKILKVPGVIPQEESEKLFNEILSTVKFLSSLEIE